MRTMRTKFLVADVGGTNTRLALADGKHFIRDTVRNFDNQASPSLEKILHQFLQAHDLSSCDGCCLAVAGPHLNGRVHLTNLDWTVDPAHIRATIKTEKVVLLNDLQAVGYALDHLNHTALLPLIDSAPACLDFPRLVIGIGTGFNACVVRTVNGRLTAMPSECGHTMLPVRDQRDLRLSEFVRHHADFAALEDVLSGRGLEMTYAWIGAEQGRPQTKSAAEICAALNRDNASSATAAANVFVRILGAATGDLALTHLPFGGIFLTGGVARHLAANLKAPAFINAFGGKGRKSELMKEFSVSLITDEFVALSGCAVFFDEPR